MAMGEGENKAKPWDLPAPALTICVSGTVQLLQISLRILPL